MAESFQFGGGADRRRLLLWIAIVALAYLAAGVLVLEPSLRRQAVARVVWPSAGVGIAALVLGGRSLWPGVALGAVLTTYLSGGGLLLTVATAVGNTLEALSAAYLLQRWRFNRSFDRTSHVLGFAAAVVPGAGCSAVFGVAGMLGEGLSAASAPRIVALWAASHAMGAIVLAPVLLTATDIWKWTGSRARLAELGVIVVSLIALGMATFVYDPAVPLSYLPFPILIWAAVRFGPVGAAAANLVLSGIALRWSALGFGPFVVSPSISHAETWWYCTVTAVTTLFLGALVAEGQDLEQVRDRRERDYRLLIEQAADGVLIFSREGLCVDANSSACQMLGRRFNQMTGLAPEAFVVGPHASRVRRNLGGLRPGKAGVYSWRLQRRDGSTFPAEVSVKRFEDGRLQAFIRDDTRRKSLEEQLLQAQKMDAVGQLAGGVAHEFNNILTLILGHTYALRSMLEPGSGAEDRVLRIVDAAERAGKLTRRLLAFARKEPAEPQVVELNDLLSELDDVLPRLLGEDVQFVTVLSATPWKVSVDPGLLQQVLLNVALNARDAMPEGGRLVIECRNTHLQGSKAGALPPGDYVQLVITDTGVGMDSAVRARVFEPFFTTKTRKEGTGLGLAVSYGIIKQAGGEIRVHSEPGEGSTVEIYLPRVRGTSAEATPVVAEAPARSVKGEQILVVEDEAGVRELAVDALLASGYRVWVAADGEEALRLSKQNADEPVDLVVSDVVLPGVSGPEAVRAIRRDRPGLPVLFISGYPEERTASDELRTVGTGFLAKPFTPPELVAAVRAMLDGGAQRDAEAS